MGSISIRVIEDGVTKEMELQDGELLGDAFDLAEKVFSVNGEPAQEETPLDEGDVVAEQKTAGGN